MRYFLKLIFTAWFFYTLLLFGMILLGRTAPENGDLAFFAQGVRGTDYWHFDLFTAVSFKDAYSGRFLITGLENIYNRPLEHFISIEAGEAENMLYEVDLGSRQQRFLGTYPQDYHYFVLAGDFLFPVDYSDGSYDWTRIHIPSTDTEAFMEDFRLESPAVSPDSRWLTGRSGRDSLFINMLDASSYRLSGYCCIRWSPDSRWYMVTPQDNPSFISVFSADAQPHPILPQSFQAISASWTSDSQAILFEQEGHLAEISLATGEISEWSFSAENLWIPCLSPNQRFIIAWDETELALVNLDSGRVIWRLNHPFSQMPSCFWSANSRYLSLHIAEQRQASIDWQSFIFIDTLTGVNWERYPDALPENPLYFHIPQ